MIQILITHLCVCVFVCPRPNKPFNWDHIISMFSLLQSNWFMDRKWIDQLENQQETNNNNKTLKSQLSLANIQYHSISVVSELLCLKPIHSLMTFCVSVQSQFYWGKHVSSKDMCYEPISFPAKCIYQYLDLKMWSLRLLHSHGLLLFFFITLF